MLRGAREIQLVQPVVRRGSKERDVLLDNGESVTAATHDKFTVDFIADPEDRPPQLADHFSAELIVGECTDSRATGKIIDWIEQDSISFHNEIGIVFIVKVVCGVLGRVSAGGVSSNCLDLPCTFF